VTHKRSRRLVRILILSAGMGRRDDRREGGGGNQAEGNVSGSRGHAFSLYLIGL
jgi:hypothetical protein